MGDVLIDACGWVALIDGEFNIDTALSQIVGPPHFILLDLVLEELGQIESERPRGKKLMLDLLLQRSTRIEHPTMHTDNARSSQFSQHTDPYSRFSSQASVLRERNWNHRSFAR